MIKLIHSEQVSKVEFIYIKIPDFKVLTMAYVSPTTI